MINLYGTRYEKILIEEFKIEKYKKNKINKILNLKFILNHIEIIKLKKILNNANLTEINEFFNQINIFEKQKYKKFKYIDYFFLEKLDFNQNINQNIKKIKIINQNFQEYANQIYYKNKIILDELKKKKKIKNKIIIGGFQLYLNQILLKENKDIDLLDLESEKSFTNMIIKINSSKLNIEIFSNQDLFFKEFNINKKDIVNLNGFKILNKEKIILINKNIFGINRKNILVLSYYKQENTINEILKKKIINTYPLTNKTNKLIKEVLNNKYYNQYDFYNLDKKYYSEVILLINYFIKDLNLSIKIHNILYNKLINENYRSKINIDDRIIAMRLLFSIYYKELIYQNKNLEERINLTNNLEIILKKILNEYINNYQKNREIIDIIIKNIII